MITINLDREESSQERHLSLMFESCSRGVSSTNLSAIYVGEPKKKQTHQYLFKASQHLSAASHSQHRGWTIGGEDNQVTAAKTPRRCSRCMRIMHPLFAQARPNRIVNTSWMDCSFALIRAS